MRFVSNASYEASSGTQRLMRRRELLPSISIRNQLENCRDERGSKRKRVFTSSERRHGKTHSVLTDNANHVRVHEVDRARVRESVA